MKLSTQLYEVLGAIEECNSYLGISIERIDPSNEQILNELRHFQEELLHLWHICEKVSTPISPIFSYSKRRKEILSKVTKKYELNVPGGAGGAAELFHTRNLLRKVQREMHRYLRMSVRKDQFRGCDKYLDSISSYLYFAACTIRSYSDPESECDKLSSSEE